MESYTHITGTFIGKGGIEIFFQSWNAKTPRGILIIAHGLGEHSGRYMNLIKELKGKGVTVYAKDHRGHGKSGGKRGHVDSFMDYIYDLKLFIDYINEDNSGIPIILLGHSLGGIIAAKYALTYSEDIVGLVLSSPGFTLTLDIKPWKLKLYNLVSKYIPSYTRSSGIRPEDLTHDEYEIDARENDPLIHDRISASWFTEYIKSGDECLNRALELRMPMLIFHGKGDKIVDYEGSERFHSNASSLDKELLLIDDFYHETLNEKDNGQLLKKTAKWLLGKFKKQPSKRKKSSAAKSKKRTKKSKPGKSAKKTAKKSITKPVKKTKKKADKKGVKKSAAKSRSKKKSK